MNPDSDKYGGDPHVEHGAACDDEGGYEKDSRPHIGHSHSGHDHHSLPADFGKAFAIGIALNVTYVILQALFGLAAHSLALLSDAGHNLSDVFGLLLAWAATMLARKRPTAHYTYGLRRSTILASLANATLLLVAIGCITWEAIRRFGAQEHVAGTTVVWVAACGVAVNWLTAMLFMAGRKEDLNVRGAFLHMAADAAVSAGVVVAGILILLTGWWWLDPAVSLLINAVVVWGTWGLLRDSVNMAMDAVPAGVDYASVQGYFRGLQGIADFHHLHIWALSTTETALTVHLVKPDSEGDDALLGKVSRELNSSFGIGHATIQFERNRSAINSAAQSRDVDCVQKGSDEHGLCGGDESV
jgi:cobalt-zinc-cadmium efflux system protein